MIARVRSFVIVALLAAFVVVSLSAARLTRAQSDQLEANKATVALFYGALSDASRVAELETLMAEDFVVHMPEGDAGWDDMKATLALFATALSDMTFTPLIMLAEGNQVAARYEFHATFVEELPNWDGTVIPPTGEPVQVFANALFTFTDDGLLQSYGEIFDNLSFMTQLGVFPTDPAMGLPAEPVDPAMWTIAETTPEFRADLVERLSAANAAAYNEGDLDALNTVYAPDFVAHPYMSDLAATKAEIEMLRSAVPDLRAELVTIVSEGNWLAYHWTATGTFTNDIEYMGMPLTATGAPIAYEGIAFAVANTDGLITAEWNEADNLAIATQFGMFAME